MDIEDYLKAKGYYYDRRKNYYRNQRRPYNRIISITYLAQSLISIVLRRPNDARARPSTLIREEDDYATIFSSDYPMPLYLKSIEIMKHIEQYLRERNPGISSSEIINYKFHLAMYATLLLSNNSEASIGNILEVNIEEMTQDFLDDYFEKISGHYSAFGMGSYPASKNREIVDQLIEEIRRLTYPGS